MDKYTAYCDASSWIFLTLTFRGSQVRQHRDKEGPLLRVLGALLMPPCPRWVEGHVPTMGGWATVAGRAKGLVHGRLSMNGYPFYKILYCEKH